MGTAIRHTSTWSLSFSEALLFFLLAATATVGLCAVAALRKKKRAEENVVPAPTAGLDGIVTGEGEQPMAGCGGILEVAARALCCGGVNVQVETGEGRGVGWSDVEVASAALAAPADRGGITPVASPLWQRRILIGERCRMPRFSGLILYDERGQLLRANSAKRQEKPAAVVTTLKNLL